MNRPTLTRALPWVALLAVWFLWGSTYLGIRVAVETIPPFLMAGVRYLIAGGVLAAVLSLWHRQAWRELRRAQWRSLTVTALLLLVGGNGVLCLAELQLPSGVAALVVATTPIWMVVVSAALARTRVTAAAWIGLALGTAGILALTMLRPGSGASISGLPLVPTLLVLGASFSWALGSVLARRDAAIRANPLIPALEMLVGGAMQLLVGIVLGEARGFDFAHVSSASLYGFWWLVGPGAIVGYSAYMYAVRTLPTNIVATYAYVNPIVAVALAAWLLHEPVTLNVIAGGALIVFAVVAIVRSGKPASASAVQRKAA